MITFIAHLRVCPENAQAFEDLMAHVTAMTLENEPGVAYYGFAKSVEEADTYVVVVALPSIMNGVGVGLDRLQRATPIGHGLDTKGPRVRSRRCHVYR